MTHPDTFRLTGNDLVLSDFDATISVIDTGLAMINCLGPDAETAWDLEHRWRRGEIDSKVCLRGQWALLKKPVREIYELIDSLQLDETFFDFLQLVRERGAGLAILSDGLDFYVDRLLGRHGVRTCDDDTQLRGPDCVVRLANAATLKDGQVTIEFRCRHACEQCGNCKTYHLFRLRRNFARTIYIGDGHSDLCAARYADIVFAKDALAEDCRRAGRAFYSFSSFADVSELLQ